jgi:hypothetical protein
LEPSSTGDDDRAGNRGQIARLAALLVVPDQFVDLPADDLPLVGLVVRRDPALEDVPVHLRRHAAALPSAHGRVVLLAVAQHLEADELVDVLGRERRLVEPHAELLHLNGGDIDHG